MYQFQFSDKQLQDLQLIMFKHYRMAMTRDEARRMANDLLELYFFFADWYKQRQGIGQQNMDDASK